MALTNRKFNDPAGWDNPSSDFYGHGNYGKADRPGLSTENMQKVMDENGRTIIAPRINSIIDDLTSTTDGASGADQIGATSITGGTAETVQGILEELAMGGVVTGVTPGSYGHLYRNVDSPKFEYPIFTVDQYGRLTYAYGYELPLFDVETRTIAAGNTYINLSIYGSYFTVQCREYGYLAMGQGYTYLKDSDYTVTFTPGSPAGTISVQLAATHSGDVEVIVLGRMSPYSM